MKRKSRLDRHSNLLQRSAHAGFLCALSAMMLVYAPPNVHAQTQPATQEKDELSRQATWNTHSLESIGQKLTQWADESGKGEATKQLISRGITAEQAKTTSKLDFIAKIITRENPAYIDLHKSLQQQRIASTPPEFSKLLDAEKSAVVRNHLRLYVARWLAQNEFYDESLRHLDRLTAEDVLTPSSLLFYKSLVQHQLLKKDDCIKTLDTLLERESELPRRFQTLGKMMLADLQPLKTDSLDEISRIMKDIRRRTGFHRSGKLVLGQEKEVIRKLDKLIKELEDKQKQQQQSSAQGSESAQPMQDSQNTNNKGTGETRNKKIAEGGQWGDLPPAQRAAALAEMAKDMPPHYRSAIEEYFRRLAKEGDK